MFLGVFCVPMYGEPLCMSDCPCAISGPGVKKVKERKKTDNPREGWEDGTPPPHRDFKERGVVR